MRRARISPVVWFLGGLAVLALHFLTDSGWPIVGGLIGLLGGLTTRW